METIMGISFLGIGSLGVCASAILEWRTKRHIWDIAMKVFPWFIGIGGILFAIGD